MFEGNYPLTVYEFLYYYKPSEINQSLGFYQFTARGRDYRLIKSLVTSDRNWKTEFFFVSGFWAGRPIEVDRDPFPPYTRELGNLRLEGMLVPTFLFNLHFYLQFKNPNSCFFVLLFVSGARRPHLDRFYVECIQKARLYTDRMFHSLVSLQRLAT